jgi:hypothetical protein
MNQKQILYYHPRGQGSIGHPVTDGRKVTVTAHMVKHLTRGGQGEVVVVVVVKHSFQTPFIFSWYGTKHKGNFTLM